MNCTTNATITPQLGLVLSPGAEHGGTQDSGGGGGAGGGLWVTSLLGVTLMFMCAMGCGGQHVHARHHAIGCLA
ncbi:hypothetical protein CgunFtcFv8_021489 [Champsocephalus gunnari]|uniref:Uncharacterized protein n=1 Tax=Champsocephalus gunnari TaxID=52237 RepID=A0AAN8HWI8_CHAGU|nr:hypothetical protein CgunFtcFv8_021489 [Champsocephalus gunnari]